MKKSKKEAKFFCESCGSEVPRRSKTCPMCGKFFAAVRCPQCGRTGTNDDFINGCPTCGYAVNPQFVTGNSGNIKFNNKSPSGALAYFFNSNKRKSGYADSSLPIWVYVSSIAVLFVLVGCLYSCL